MTCVTKYVIPHERRQQLREDMAAAKSERRLFTGKTNKPPENPETLLRQKARREMAYAWRFVQHSIETGRIKKPEHCQFCKEPDVEAHHLDYENPRKIVWLCKGHHDVYTQKRSSSSPRRTRAVLDY